MSGLDKLVEKLEQEGYIDMMKNAKIAPKGIKDYNEFLVASLNHLLVNDDITFTQRSKAVDYSNEQVKEFLESLGYVIAIDEINNTYSLNHVELPDTYMELPEVYGCYDSFMMDVAAYFYRRGLISEDLIEKMFGVYDEETEELIHESEFSSKLTNDILEGLIVKYGYIVRVRYDIKSDDASYIYKLEFKKDGDDI